MGPVTRHGMPPHNVHTAPPLELVTENGLRGGQERAVVCFSGSDEETTCQSRQERRRTQKRLSAQRKRDKEKQNRQHLQSTNRELRAERECLRRDILRLEANCRFYNSLLSTVKEMRAIGFNHPQPFPPPPPSPSPASPPPSGVRDRAVGTPVTTTTASVPSASVVNDSATMLTTPDLAQKSSVQAAAAEDGETSACGDIPGVRKSEMQWNQIPAVGELRGPLPLKSSLSPLQDSVTASICAPPPPLLALPEHDLQAMNTSSLHTDEDEGFDILTGYLQSCQEAHLEVSFAEDVVVEEQPDPLHGLTGSAVFSFGGLPAGFPIECPHQPIFGGTPPGVLVHTTNSLGQLMSSSAENFT